MLFSEGIAKYGAAIESGVPLYVQAVIEKQEEDKPPRMLFNSIKTLDTAIAETSKGLEIAVNDVAAVRAISQALLREHFGANKIYIKPELPEWDVRIALPKNYALDNGELLTKLRAIAGVTEVKEI